MGFEGQRRTCVTDHGTSSRRPRHSAHTQPTSNNTKATANTSSDNNAATVHSTTLTNPRHHRSIACLSLLKMFKP